MERIRAAALLFHDGRIVEEDDHHSCRLEAGFDSEEDEYWDLYDNKLIEEGFATTAGRFVTRDEALVLARRGKQAYRISENDRDWLLAEDVHTFAEN